MNRAYIKKIFWALLTTVCLANISMTMAAAEAKPMPSLASATLENPKQLNKHLLKTLKNHYVALCYHDVRDDVLPLVDPDRFAVSTHELARQFEWLATNGYHPVSIDQIIAASEGGEPLPDNAVLLTFDDGYRSFYTHIFPLLKMYNYPAVFALVTNWIEMPAKQRIDVGHHKLTRKDFMTWAQVREVAQSGLVEFSSHTHNLHRGILANGQGNIEPAAVVPRYFSKSHRYETQQQYKQRIHRDLKTSSDLIYRHTGKRPRVITWPYGRRTAVANDVARSLGMTFSLTLKDKVANDVHERRAIERILMSKNIPISTYTYQLVERQKRTLAEKGEVLDFYYKIPEPQRIIQVDLDYIYDTNPAQVNANLSKLLDRVQRMRVSAVYLQAFADQDADGVASALYFPNPHLPVRMDLFNRVAWQLKTRTEAAVYAWLPVMAFKLPDAQQQAQLQLSPADAKAHQRLDITKPKARQIIRDIYQSLAFHNEIDGLLFHDDAYFREQELPRLSAEEKTDLILAFTDELTETFRQYRPRVKTARNLFASVILEPESEQWFAQNFAKFLQHYDYTAIMAMPYLEKARHPKRWLKRLVKAVKAYPQGLDKSIFEIQTVNWETKQPLSSQHIAEKMQWLLEEGVMNFGYYPDDFIQGHPKLSVIRPKFSLSTTPFPE
ncbi:MAG: poly-beta-1,6-N-acetyl-D-glucosamine N-deacetylase PgaB [Gammaproteobacteria bacterium]|nr:MAG: poly-beta-1,6-N-acetyl-D-glucosamine N-deacetylase PgaB [Gammaproteobacteria bacterium]